jgi:hypothetical protein
MTSLIQSKQSAYYCAHREKVLIYKKEHYQKKRAKYQLLKSVLIRGFTKKESNTLIKLATDLNKLFISINDADLSVNEFMKKYRLKQYRILEVDALISNDFGRLSNNSFEDAIKCINGNYELRVSVFVQQLTPL